MSKTSPLRVGVLIIQGVQLLDAAPIDLFGMLTKEYLTACKLPAPLIAQGVEVQIHYIHDTAETSIAECTANAGLRITTNILVKDVAPGQLDILFIPGPDPSLVPSEEVLEYIRGQVQKDVTVLCVCTAIFPLAMSGALKGKKATAPRGLIAGARKKYPETEWVEKRWARDGKIWTSGGITNGLDMVAAYIKETYPGPLSEMVCNMADVGDRGEEYGTSSARETSFWLWLIIRSWFKSRR